MRICGAHARCGAMSRREDQTWKIIGAFVIVCALLTAFDLWPHQFAKNYWSVSFPQRLYRLFGTIIEQKVVDWGGDRHATLLDDQGGQRRTKDKDNEWIRGTKQQNNKTTR